MYDDKQQNKKSIIYSINRQFANGFKQIVSCEGINLGGKEISTNGKVSSELEIDITNGQNIPTDENQMNDLGKQIALVVKQALQDKSQYNTYKVLFVTKREDAGVTQRTWKGKIFKSEEL